MQASQKVQEIQSEELTRIRESEFFPLFYLGNRHLQTILANIVHPSFPTLTKQRLDLEDGDLHVGIIGGRLWPQPWLKKVFTDF